MILSLDGQKVVSRQPVSWITQGEYYNYDGTAFGNFTLMHAILRAIQPGTDIMPAILIVYDDDTCDLDAFDATMKTTMYRKLTETAKLVENQNVVEVCYMSLYLNTPITSDTPRTSRERIHQAKSDMLVCASIDKDLNEKEYIFDGKLMEKMEYVACVMKNGRHTQLGISSTNLFPIKCAFEKKLKETSN